MVVEAAKGTAVAVVAEATAVTVAVTVAAKVVTAEVAIARHPTRCDAQTLCRATLGSS